MFVSPRKVFCPYFYSERKFFHFVYVNFKNTMASVLSNGLAIQIRFHFEKFRTNNILILENIFKMFMHVEYSHLNLIITLNIISGTKCGD